jgi:hypothetical protein
VKLGLRGGDVEHHWRLARKPRSGEHRPVRGFRPAERDASEQGLDRGRLVEADKVDVDTVGQQRRQLERRDAHQQQPVWLAAIADQGSGPLVTAVLGVEVGR